MQKVLIKTNYNWADEADFPSWCILKEDEWEAIKQDIVNFFSHSQYYTILVGVGTNEDIEFDSMEDVMRNLKVIPINDNEIRTILRLFDRDEYGECNIKQVHLAVLDGLHELDEERDPDNDKIEEDDI